MEMDPESTQRKLVDFDEEKRRQRGQHGNGGGNTVAERLARLETRIQYPATEAYIEKRVNSLLLARETLKQRLEHLAFLLSSPNAPQI